MRLIHKVESKTLSGLVAKVYRDEEWDEYRVSIFHMGQWGETSDYHTNDKADAMGTAPLMLKRVEDNIERGFMDRLARSLSQEP